MSTASSPKKLLKKQSLSILSSSHINQLHNKIEGNEPRKERIVSASTGLIKFSLQKSNRINNKENASYPIECLNPERNIDKKLSPERENNCIPIYVPIDDSKIEKTTTSADEILFQMAAKQRRILDLEQQLDQANQELTNLETEYKKLTTTNSETSILIQETKPFTASQRLASVAQTIRKSTSMMNINPKINEDFAKTQKQMTDSFNQFTNNLSKNNFFFKSKCFLESKVQVGNEILNSIFEKSDSSNDDSGQNSSLDELTEAFDYSVDLDLNRLSNMTVGQKYKREILDDLEDIDEENDALERTSTFVSNYSEEDYGGDPVAI